MTVLNGPRTAEMLDWLRRNGRYGTCLNCPHDVMYHAVLRGDGHCYAYDVPGDSFVNARGKRYRNDRAAVRCGCPGPHVKAFGRNG